MNNVDGLLKTADEGLYLARRDGRNCVATVGLSEVAQA